MLIVSSASWSARSTRRALPGQGVGRAARIGTGREYAGLRITPRHHRADAARAGLAHVVAESPQLGARPLGDGGLDVQLARPIHARIERVDERLRGEARRLDRLLRVHPEDEEIQHELEIGLALIVAARAWRISAALSWRYAGTSRSPIEPSASSRSP